MSQDTSIDGGTSQDADVLAELWRRHGDEIRDRCRALMRNTEDAKEALSRTMFRVALKLPKHGRRVIDARSWALALTYRVCMDLYRERVRRREDSIDDLRACGAAGLSYATDDPERLALAKELESVVHAAISRLPERLQSAMWLYVWSGSYGEVATLLDITEVNARKRIQEARATMRASVAEYRSGGETNRRSATPCRALAAYELSKCGRG
jgi:RNA polymerase sigma-70 factor (ECF subfamily)